MALGEEEKTEERSRRLRIRPPQHTGVREGEGRGLAALEGGPAAEAWTGGKGGKEGKNLEIDRGRRGSKVMKPKGAAAIGEGDKAGVLCPNG